MPTEAKKGITVKVDAALHAEVKQYLEEHGMTMAEFVTLALTNELHPKIQMKEEKDMGNMRTLAFQVPEDLFMRIKGYLQRNNMTQKDFVIGLIEHELDREQAMREGIGEVQEIAREGEEAAERDSLEAEMEESEDGSEEQEENTTEDGLEAESEESEGYEEEQEETATEDGLKEECGDFEGCAEEQEEGATEDSLEAESEESGMEIDSGEMGEPYDIEAGDGEFCDENEPEEEDEDEGMGFTMGM